MLLPYSTDAPIYHFPRMTAALIVVNAITFSITEMGAASDGWMLTYGHGLHPSEWLAYNFLHFGLMHLIGNMFFLWAFGIVVEGKLGWWKFLLLYLGVGILGGIVIQTAMLRFVPEEELEFVVHGAGGASLVIYGLMAIVLIWAPRNEVHCVWMFGFRAGTIEVEYLYFCGFYIVTEVLSAVWRARGFVMSSELGHLTGAIVGTGVGILFVKRAWVDCENWDLFSVMRGKHGAAAGVGSWQDNYVIPRVRRGKPETRATGWSFDDAQPMQPRKKKKAKPLPKLVELESFNDEFGFGDSDVPDDSTVQNATAVGNSSPNDGSTRNVRPEKSSRNDSFERISELISSGQFVAAAREYQDTQFIDSGFQLAQSELRRLADGLFQAKAINEAAAVLEEYVKRFPAESSPQRIKLAMLYLKYLRRPAAAMCQLEKVDSKSLPEGHRPIHTRAVREAQRMISAGIVDKPA